MIPLLIPLAGTESPEGIVGWVTELMERLGGPGAGLAIALENLFPPIPSEVILPLAGFAASRGDFSLVGALFWTTLGSLVGAIVLYGAGAAFGRERLRRIVDRVPLVKVSDVDRAERWFARHGDKAVLLGRTIPIFRSLISIPAGVERMSLLRFAVLTTLGSLVWNTTFVMAGYGLGENWHRVEAYAGVFQRVVIAVSVLAVMSFLAVRVVRGSRTAR